MKPIDEMNYLKFCGIHDSQEHPYIKISQPPYKFYIYNINKKTDA